MNPKMIVLVSVWNLKHFTWFSG